MSLSLAYFVAVPTVADEAEKGFSIASIFSDGTVLQRGESVPVWGWANAGAHVVVQFNGQEKTAVAGDDGKWQVKLDAMEALNTGQKMKIVCRDESKTIDDVVVGEVWFCSGQSNMTVWLGFLVASPVKEKRYQPIVDFIKKEIKTANDPLLRQFQVGIATSPFDELERGSEKGSWISSTSSADTSRFTGTGYFFGKELRSQLGVPVGLIKCDYGGTLIRPWIPQNGYRHFPALLKRVEKERQTLKQKIEAYDPVESKRKYEAALKKWEAEGKKGHKPFNWGDPAKGALNYCTLFNGMVHPVIPYGIKGVIWYQGESNSGNRAAEYAVLFEAMVRGWRDSWEKPDLPFYMAQLASFGKEGDGRQWLTEAQRLAVGNVENTGLAILNDVGETKDVHPKNKIGVGKRLALWALKYDYQQEVPAHCGPLYKNHQAKGDYIVVTFDHAGSGLMVGRKELLEDAKQVAEPLPHFEVCRALGDWHPAHAEIIGSNTIKVWSKDVPRPHWVRYAWQADLDGTMLYNIEGLPASIFTTEPNFMGVALRSENEEALIHNLKKRYAITAVRGTTTKPQNLPANVALKAKVTASSVFQDLSAENAIDGNPQTGWASSKDGRNAAMMIHLGQKYRITHIGYQSRNGVFERIESFKVASGDGGLQVCYLQKPKPQTEFQYFDIDDVDTDVIRWSVLDTQFGSNTGAIEIAIYGVPVE